ncbi:alpha/beta fold hydrolase [Atopomonas sediminilitoris]|uniref:alpha/beta fold hydrolase n=1 Tax=Atopomonas sediminilitoris TaxID=2919919 RepID=UPI001F4E33DD|nr:alpha/beta hydrolase [Atopomonas sediminilitoris]MCJ8170589.1 alpha/beta hydrolase [Atopomonas sediminilitoris]
MAAALDGIPFADWLATEQHFSFRGQRIAYWTAGSGEPLLLIHGFPTLAWDWHYLWAPLAQRYRLIACDLLGFGRSAKPRGHAYSLLEQADLQEALLDELAVNQPLHVLAHDYGDSVAQELLARHQDGVLAAPLASLVFLNGGLFPETHKPVLVQKLLLSPLGALIGRLFAREKLKQNFQRIFGPDTPPREDELDVFWQMLEHNNGRAGLHRLMRYMPERRVHRERWVRAMQQTAVPLRVIDGAVDPISGAHMVARYRELIPNPDTVLLERIGHYPQVEAPEAVLEHYLAFRQRLRSDANA